ncbi:hypothetical protein BDQ17DRAFT_1232329 [Cyathus striatus]|nr:hypothetical protein BDQ17DRAFT_1232329 [Cyathus striatus]
MPALHRPYDTEEQEFSHVKHHKEFYLIGGDLHLLAKDTLFRVHGYFFARESPQFNKMIMVPVSPGKKREGTSDSNAIKVDAEPEELAVFLRIFYNPKFSVYEWSNVSDWLTILSLSERWTFPEITKLAIRELQKHDMPTVRRLALYKKYNADTLFLVPLISELCSRDAPLALEEGMELGMEMAILIGQARERLRANPADEGRSPLPSGMGRREVDTAVLEMFGIAPDYYPPFGAGDASPDTPTGTLPS